LALTLGAATSVFAADPPSHKGPPALPEPAPIFSWSGFHVGSNFGGGFGVGLPVSGFQTDAFAPPNEVWSFPNPAPGGVLGGVQAGYDLQFGNFVFGLEADMQAAGLSGSSKGIGAFDAPLLASHQTIDWFGTVRGRIGYSVLPQLLVYGTGGFAYGGGGSRFTYFNAEGRSGKGFNSATRSGWAAGGGVEWAFLPDWSAKFEYLYVDLGRSPGHAFNEVDPEGETLTNIATLTGVNNRFHAVRAGLNYRFNPFDPDGSFASGALFTPVSSDKFHEIETHYIFGFTDGADIDAEGEKELEFITLTKFGKRRLLVDPTADDFVARLSHGGFDGYYRSIEQKVEFEHTLTQNFQYSLGVIGSNYRIRGIDGLDDFTNTSLRGLSGEFRYVLVGRGEGSPFGVTLQVEPEWGHVSGGSGQQETAFDVESKLIVDTELIANRVYAAVNLLYEPELSRGLGEDKWERESTLGVTGGLTYRLTPQIALGGGLQYYRHHGLDFGFDHLDGQALFAGPTLHVRLTKKIFLSAAFSTQVTGHAAGEFRALDLANFSRHMARVQVGVEF